MLFERKNAPHIKSPDGIRVTMIDVLLSLAALLVLAAFYFGFRAVILTAVSVISCVLFEFLYNLVFREKQTIGDFSAVVTGVIIALMLPASVPLWYPVVAGMVAILLAKKLFGGIGKNIFNPALVGVAFLTVSSKGRMLSMPQPLSKLPLFANPDAESLTAVPAIDRLHAHELPDQSMLEMFLGNQAGAMGTTCALLMIVASFYLLYRKIITIHIPLAFLATVAVVALIFPRIPSGAGLWQSVAYELMSGSVLFCSIFVATDPVTSPISGWAKIIYGVGCGLLTMLIRHLCAYSEGAVFAILVMNSVTFALDKLMWRMKSRGGVVSE